MNFDALSDKLTPLQIEFALRCISDADSIAIITHQNPDGDAMGSSLAMRHLLLALGKTNVTNIVPTSFPDFLAWIPGVDSAIQYEQQPEAARAALRDADLVICTDLGEPTRVAALSDILTERFNEYENATAKDNTEAVSCRSAHSLLIVDHHLSPVATSHPEQIAYPDSASASELVFRLAYQIGRLCRGFNEVLSGFSPDNPKQQTGLLPDNAKRQTGFLPENPRQYTGFLRGFVGTITSFLQGKDLFFDKILTPEFATCIYTGMMTDTGNFSYNSCQPEMYSVVAILLTTGINKDAIYDRVFNAYSADRMRLIGYCLYHKMKIFPEYHTALITLNRREMYRFNAKSGDMEGIVNMPMQIKDIYYSVFMREDKIPPHQLADANGEKIKAKISFRSRGNRPVNILAREVFRGGGHMNASGGEFFGSVDQAAQKFIDTMPKYLLTT